MFSTWNLEIYPQGALQYRIRVDQRTVQSASGLNYLQRVTFTWDC